MDSWRHFFGFTVATGRTSQVGYFSTGDPGCLMNLADVLKFLIEKGPGRTGEELIHAIWGSRPGEEVRVRQELEHLSDYGHINRLGRGNNRDPFRNYPPNTTISKKNP